jgi:uncharacterized membrane protein (UPF0127 family)
MTSRRTGDLRARRRSDNAIVCHSLWLGESFSQRFMGLMGRASLADGEGLYLPTSSIHMFFMRFAIDALFVTAPGADGARRVVGMREHLPPWRGIVLPVRGAQGVIELPAGTLRAHGVQVGDEVVFEPTGADQLELSAA